MDKNAIDQMMKLIDKSQRILLMTHAKADCDGLGSMVSMYLALKQLGKDPVAVTNDPAPENLGFLPSIGSVRNSLSGIEDFVIRLNVSKTPLSKIKYHLEEGYVNIVATPKSGRFGPEDVSFGAPEGKDEHFDLIMTFDTGNLEHLGPIYDRHADLFFKAPIINVDHHASNTDFGQVNLVDVVAASTTQILLELLKEMEKKYQAKLIDEHVATLLLAGLITDTGSFQHSNTSPQAMETAAELLDLGARQQEIIKQIYKTKKLSTLKLWGLVLSKVKSDPVHRIVWSTVAKQDLDSVGASSEESEGIIDDLLSNAPGAEIIMLAKHSDEGVVSVSMRSTTNSVDVGAFCRTLGGGGHVRAAGFKVRDGRSMEEVAQTTLKALREFQAGRLNLHPGPTPMHEEKKAEKKESILPSAQKPQTEAKKNPGEEVKKPKVTYLDFSASKEGTSANKDPGQAKDEKPKADENLKK